MLYIITMHWVYTTQVHNTHHRVVDCKTLIMNKGTSSLKRLPVMKIAWDVNGLQKKRRRRLQDISCAVQRKMKCESQPTFLMIIILIQVRNPPSIFISLQPLISWLNMPMNVQILYVKFYSCEMQTSMVSLPCHRGPQLLRRSSWRKGNSRFMSMQKML